MIRFTEADITFLNKEKSILFDENIWENVREVFNRHSALEHVIVPIVNEKREILCYAYNDKEANRELRMLLELQRIPEAKNFKTLYGEVTDVIIYGCNELSYFFSQYLKTLGLNVWTIGKYWDLFNLGSEENTLGNTVLRIYAEGVEKSCNEEELFLRSVSVEFEYIDLIYECNFREGIIKNNDGTFEELKERLKENSEIIICGTNTECLDAYDLLYSAGIDIYCFMSDKSEGTLLGKPLYDRNCIEERLSYPIFIECSGSYSVGGEYGVDEYAYRGYMRNEQYILLKDYTEIPVSGLKHVLFNKIVVLSGEYLLRNRVKKYLITNNITPAENIAYDIRNVPKSALCLLMVPPEYLSVNYKKYYDFYQKSLYERGILDVTDYFSRTIILAQLQMDDNKYACDILQPAGIIIGCSAAYSGNILLNNIFDNHPNIMLMPEYNFLSKQLFSICIRLAEENSSNILDAFWRIYAVEAGERAITYDFPKKTMFSSKMKELLQLKNRFSSQEIFVMLFIAYEGMYNRSFDMSKTYIYWEPHNISREISKKYKQWLFHEKVNVYILRLVRNNFMRSGSTIKDADLSYHFVGREMSILRSLLTHPEIDVDKEDNCKILEYRFEDVKLNPKQVLGDICEKTGLTWSDTFLETTMHGQVYYYHGNVTTGFDLKPIYNTFEKYLSEYDRMRIVLLAAPFQKKFNYPWVDYKIFSRRELQEMFLKVFRVEMFLNLKEVDRLKFRMEMHKKSEEILWKLRYQEMLDIN